MSKCMSPPITDLSSRAADVSGRAASSLNHRSGGVSAHAALHEVITAVLKTHAGETCLPERSVSRIVEALPISTLDELVVLLDKLWVRQPYAVAHELLRIRDEL